MYSYYFNDMYTYDYNILYVLVRIVCIPSIISPPLPYSFVLAPPLREGGYIDYEIVLFSLSSYGPIVKFGLI